jgi:UDP-glucose 4-epimerase
MTKSVLLTGGFGTLGGRISADLSKNPEINLRLASRQKRQPPSWAPKAEVCVIDFENENSIKQMFQEVTHVVHLAALNDYECRAEPEMAKLVNVEYTRRIVEQASDIKNLRFIYFSTIQVYGNNLSGIITETSPTNPRDAYSQTHLDAEQIVEHAHSTQQLEGVRLRSANGFGAPMSPDAKIWQIIANDLCRQAVETKKLTLKSHGQQFRNFVPFTDICSAVNHVLQLEKQQVADGLFNVGGRKSLQIIQVAELVASRCEVVLDFKPKIEKPNETPDSVPLEFKYSSAKLLATGLNLDSEIEKEIDSLLQSCKNWFKFKN